MPWFKNKVTGVKYQIEDKRALEIAEGNTDLELLKGEPQEDTKEAVEPVEPTKADEIAPEAKEDAAEGKGDYAGEVGEAGVDMPDALDQLDKAALIELAKEMKIPTSKKNVDELREAIRSAE